MTTIRIDLHRTRSTNRWGQWSLLRYDFVEAFNPR